MWTCWKFKHLQTSCSNLALFPSVQGITAGIQGVSQHAFRGSAASRCGGGIVSFQGYRGLKRWNDETGCNERNVTALYIGVCYDVTMLRLKTGSGVSQHAFRALMVCVCLCVFATASLSIASQLIGSQTESQGKVNESQCFVNASQWKVKGK